MAKRRNQRIQFSGNCYDCGTATLKQARYCHGCGKYLVAEEVRPGFLSRLNRPFLMSVSFLLGALIVLPFVFWPIDRNSVKNTVRPEIAGTPFPTQARNLPDLSTLSKREAADQLFNRVMTASEQGKFKEVKFFAPMAIKAYEQISDLDDDGLYHTALVHLAQNNLEPAMVRAGEIRRKNPDHLLALTIEYAVAQRLNDTQSMKNVTEHFLKAVNKEAKLSRPEYLAHGNSIKRFWDQAKSRSVPNANLASAIKSSAGKELFRRNCGACHGRDALGTKIGPPLVHRYYEPSHHNDQAFRRAVQKGVKQHHWNYGNMPPISGVSSDEINQIIAFVRKLQVNAGIR